MKKLRKWIILGVVVVVIAAVAVIITNNQRNAAQAAALASVQVGRVTRATLLSTVDSSGSVSPASSGSLSFATAGTVAKVNVQVGVRVKQGDVLAELDTSNLQVQAAQAEQAFIIQQANYSMTIQSSPLAITSAQIALSNAGAAYQLAQQKYSVNSTDQVFVSCNNVANAQQTYNDALNAYNAYMANWRNVVNGTDQSSGQKAKLDRAKAAYDQVVTTCTLAQSSVNNSGVQSAYAALVQAQNSLANLLQPSDQTVAQARTQLDQARIAADQAQQNLAAAQLMAPFDGVVTAVNATVGGPSGSSGVIMLADVSKYHVDVLVDETEIGQVKIGQKVQITYDAIPVTSTGMVSRIAPAGTISQGVVNYLVRVDLDAADPAMRISMTANLRIILDTHANVLAVPGGAVRSDAQGYYVNVVDATGNSQRVDVTTGFTDGNLTEVNGNLQPGARVYISEPPATNNARPGGGGLFGLRIGG
jgi:HlyD family secretion protein